MITPRFTLTQNRSSLTIKIRAPYCNLKELDVNVENNKFIFACVPYYLRLNLPGNILENDSTRGSYDSDTGEFTFVYEKENKEEFPNLDFITTFLQPKTVEVYECGRKIEVLTSDGESSSSMIDQSCTKEYGFALRGGYGFQNVKSEFSDVFYVNPFEIEFNRRRELRIANEQREFDREHYIADVMDDLEINKIVKLTCPFESLNKDNIEFTTKELDFLKDLNNIDYNLTVEQINFCHNSLIEILFAYCYDRRTTFYEGTCESDWTISNISASFCWFDSFNNPKDAIICAYRRSLIYPLYRSFKLCQKILEDLKSLLKLGNKYIIHCLIDIHNIFLGGNNGRYVLNKLFVNDYIVYMMKCQLTAWTEVVEAALELDIKKSELGLNLIEIEKSTNNELVEVFKNLKLEDGAEDSDDTITSESHGSTKSDSENSSESNTDCTCESDCDCSSESDSDCSCESDSDCSSESKDDCSSESDNDGNVCLEKEEKNSA